MNLKEPKLSQQCATFVGHITLETYHFVPRQIVLQRIAYFIIVCFIFI